MVTLNNLTASPATLAKGDLLPVYDTSTGYLTQVSLQQVVARAYGDIKLVADTAAQTLTATFAKLTVFDATTASYGVTVAGDFDAITVAQAGIYEISFSCNFSAATAKTFSIAVSVGDAEDVDAQVALVVPATGAANVYAASFVVLKSLAASAVITIEAKVHSATSVTTFNNIDLVIKKIDETS